MHVTVSNVCTIIQADALHALSGMPADTFQCCVTSPPYWGLRDYEIAEQIGAETSVDEYIAKLVAVFEQVRRVLTIDGTLWLNIGDSYTSGGRTWRDSDKKLKARGMTYRPPTPDGLKPKDLIGIPWRLAFALQAVGWYLRADIIWHKPNNMPESVKDRPTRSHEYVFFLTKSEQYYYNYEAVRERAENGQLKNKRSVWPFTPDETLWNINTEPHKEAHFAVFPKGLVRPCISAGSAPGSHVLDPFFGTGTVGEVCLETGRRCTGIELNPEYVEIARKRLTSVTPPLMM